MGQELQARAISEVNKKVNKIIRPKIIRPKLKQAVNSELGQEIISEVGKNAFEKLGIIEPPRRNGN